MTDPLKTLSTEARKGLRKASFPDWMSPMLAVLTERRFSRPDWIYEPKLDGERCLAFKSGREVRLLSRNRKELNGNYPEAVDALVRQKIETIVLDGEIVAFHGDIPSFARLQGRMQTRDPERARRSGVEISYYLFDCLYANGHDLTRLPLLDRKRVLKAAISFRPPLHLAEHVEEKGEAFFEQMCKKGWEGIIAKRSDAPYTGSRSGDWLKFKCANQQEFVIGGYTDPKGTRTGFGALLIGYHEDGEFRYAGKVGTGYDRRTLDDLSKRLAKIERKTPPFSSDLLPRKGAHWVSPELVAEIGFSEWTRGGKLRHPRFIGLRRDKPPREVVREKAGR
jgi:bifunctional non-homologous end joining protein LigD